MVCGNCGTPNPDGVPFCATCGAPLQQAPQKPSAKQQIDALMADKSKLIKVVGIAVAAIVVVILLIALLSGGHGYGDPEDAAIAYVERQFEAYEVELDDSMFHPDVLEEDNVERELDDIEVKDIDKVSKSMRNSIEDYYDEEYDLEVTDVREVELVVRYEEDGDSEKTTRTITVVEIDGDWYVHN